MNPVCLGTQQTCRESFGQIGIVFGSVYVVAAGETIDPIWVTERADGIGVFFDPTALDQGARSPWPTWRSHPLLFPFLHGHTDGLLHLQVSPKRKNFWDSTIEAMEGELLIRREATGRRCSHI